MNVEKQSARRIGCIRSVNLSTGKAPEQEGIYGTDSQFTSLCPDSRPFNVIKQPADLGCREVRIQQQSCFLLYKGFVSIVSQSFTPFGRSAVLPNDRIVQSSAGGSFPKHDRLALVCDPDCDRTLFDGRKAFAAHSKRGLPDLFGVVFHPAISWINLRELLLGCNAVVTQAVKNDCAGTGGSLVDGE